MNLWLYHLLSLPCKFFVHQKGKPTKSTHNLTAPSFSLFLTPSTPQNVKILPNLCQTLHPHFLKTGLRRSWSIQIALILRCLYFRHDASYAYPCGLCLLTPWGYTCLLWTITLLSAECKNGSKFIHLTRNFCL